MISALNFHFQRFEFVLLQLSLILLTFLVCFGSTQCTVPTPECTAMSALNTSLNLPTSITNFGNNATNPCSKKKQKRTNKMQQTQIFQTLFILFLHLRSKKKNCFVFSTAWQGVTCASSSPTQIIKIKWGNFGLNGTIPTQIGLMTSLQWL